MILAPSLGAHARSLGAHACCLGAHACCLGAHACCLGAHAPSSMISPRFGGFFWKGLYDAWSLGAHAPSSMMSPLSGLLGKVVMALEVSGLTPRAV